MGAPSAGQSAAISGFLWVVTLCVLQIYAPKLASTPPLTIAGGFVSSLLFFFGLIFVGNLEQETGWIEVVLALIAAEMAAASVHRVCVTTCFLFSAAMLAYVNYVSKSQQRKTLQVSKQNLKKSK